MSIDEILLALLARHPRSGYDLKKWLDVEGMFYRANADQAQIYRSLRSLQREGLVDFRKEQRSGPAAKVYFLTDAGIERLHAVARQPYEPPARWQEPDFMARFTLLGPVDPGILRAQVERELEFREEQVRRFRNRDRTIELGANAAGLDEHVLDMVNEMSHRFGSAHLDDWLTWLKAVLETLPEEATLTWVPGEIEWQTSVRRAPEHR